jgi:hypothetical protein
VTMSKPGVVLKRPVGSSGPFKELADLPTNPALDGAKGRSEHPPAKTKKQPPRKIDDKSDREAALAFEKERYFWKIPEAMPVYKRYTLGVLSKAFLPALIEIPMPVRARWVALLPGQLHDGLAFLAAVGEDFQDEAFIAFLDYLYLNRLH